MKTSIFLISLVVFCLVGYKLVFAKKEYQKIEQRPYTVLKKYAHFELRHYASVLYSSVQLSDSSYSNSAGKGFRVLAGYIFGNNTAGQSIAMTAPVAMQMGQQVKMSFMVPQKYNKDNLPTPTNQSIQFEQQAEQNMAAISFGGWASDRKIKKYIAKLKAELIKEGISWKGDFIYLGYNAPFEVFGRRNEIAVEIVQPQ
jgi:hypothetical protein